jgi:hypothetical protein
VSTDPSNGLSFVAPGGFRISATGPLVVIILLLALGFGAIAYILRDGFQLLDEDRRRRLAEHQAILTAQNELACVLALPQEARPAALLDGRGICHYATTMFRFEGPRR